MKASRYVTLPLVAVLAIVFMTNAVGGSALMSPAQPTPFPIDSDFRSSPVMFIENVGQWPEGARFQVWGGPAGTMWLAEDAIWLTASGTDGCGTETDVRRLYTLDVIRSFRDHAIRRRNREAPTSGSALQTPTRIPASNRSTDSTPWSATSWATTPTSGSPDVPVWGGVRYVDLYPGVDLEITSEGGQMVQRLAARPDANLSAIRLQVAGADAVTVDGDALRLSTDRRRVRPCRC